MPFGLLNYGLSKIYPAEHHFTASKALKKHYDVLIIGGGGDAAAAAYNLARYHGITDIAILEKRHDGKSHVLSVFPGAAMQEFDGAPVGLLCVHLQRLADHRHHRAITRKQQNA